MHLSNLHFFSFLFFIESTILLLFSPRVFGSKTQLGVLYSGLISVLSDQLLNLIIPPETASGDVFGSASLAPSLPWPGPPAEHWNLRWPLMLRTHVSRVLRAEWFSGTSQGFVVGPEHV